MIGDKKGVYHSTLVRESPVTVTITCDGPEPSKYRGQPDFVTFKHEGETQYYYVENESCGAALTGLKGQTVSLEATGREDEADIHVGSEDQPPARKPTPAKKQQETRKPAPAQRSADNDHRQHSHAPAKMTPEEKAKKESVIFAKMKVHGAKVALVMRASFLHAQRLYADLGFTLGKEYSFEDLRALAISHFIETKSSTDISALPVSWIEKGAAPAQKPAQKQPPPEPEPEPEPPADNDDLAPDDIPF